MSLVKTNSPGFSKNTLTKFIVNTNDNELIAYKKHLKKAKQIIELEKKVNNYEKEISDIKSMLTKLLEKNNA